MVGLEASILCIDVCKIDISHVIADLRVINQVAEFARTLNVSIIFFPFMILDRI